MTTAPAPRAPEPIPYVSADDYIGERVTLELRRRRMSQTEVAPQLGMSQSNLSKKLAGQRGWSADEIVLVSRFFGVPFNELMPPAEFVPAAWNAESPRQTAPGGGSTFLVVEGGTASGTRTPNPLIWRLNRAGLRLIPGTRPAPQQPVQEPARPEPAAVVTPLAARRARHLQLVTTTTGCAS